jgi:hypothetical protein
MNFLALAVATFLDEVPILTAHIAHDLIHVNLARSNQMSIT